MAVQTLAELNDSTSASDSFTPEEDFYVAVEKGKVALQAKLPGTDNFYLVSSPGINTISALTQDQGTVVKVTPYMAGTVYKLVPQSRKATAKAYKG